MDLQEQRGGGAGGGQYGVGGPVGGSMQQKRPVCFFCVSFSATNNRRCHRDISCSHDSPANLLMAGLFHTAPWWRQSAPISQRQAGREADCEDVA